MTLFAGTRLGPYEILAPLGAGGMGEVYRARHARLDRDVAIKVLSDRLAADEQALSRFEREAKAVAALSHPNILAIHDFGEDQGVRFAVTELLEGETVRDRMARERLTWRRSVEIGIAVAEGLAAAHAKGIVHRDLKPENVFLTSGGLVKILDFGLARADLISSGEAASTLTTARQTDVGTILGTVGYMSPEQVTGEPADARSDIFSLGCLLYEMVSGRRAFVGKSTGETLASILRDHPPEIAVLGVALPAALDRIVARCLAKNRDERFQAVRDLAFHLREVSSSSAGTPVSSGGHARAIESIAVLPFANVSADPDAEYLSDGITESIIHSLSRLPNLRVMARSTLSRYKGREIDPQVVGEELKVRAVLTGRVFHRGDSLVIKTELVDVRDGSLIWGENYNRNFADILALEEDIAREISGKLRVKVTGEDAWRLARRATEDPEAYRLYLKGLFYWNKRTSDGLRKGIELFQQAIEVDPEYALAYAGIAHSYNQLGFYQYVAPQDSFPKAKAAATRALELDAALGEARSVLALVRFWYEWDWPGAEEEFRRAIAASPGFVHVHHFYGIFLTAMERFQDGLVELGRAEDLDPLSLPAQASRAYCLFHARRHDDAVAVLEKILEIESSFVPALYLLALNYTQKQMWTEATRFADRAVELSGRDSMRLCALGASLAAAGRRPEAEAIIKELAAMIPRRYVSAVETAYIYGALGETSLAFAWLEKALTERAWGMVLLRVDPRADPLRGDPRFPDLLRRVGL